MLRDFVEMCVNLGALWDAFADSDPPPNTVTNGNGQIAPAPGYRWMSEQAGKFEVCWVPGAAWPGRNLIAGPTADDWRAAPGYAWVNPTVPGCLEVRWQPR